MVARSDGAIIDKDFKDEMFKKVMAYPETKGSSMLTDLLAGRPLELGAKNGIIAKTGQENGIQTPISDLVCKMLLNERTGD